VSPRTHRSPPSPSRRQLQRDTVVIPVTEKHSRNDYWRGVSAQCPSGACTNGSLKSECS
jgi:hypothetical protein